MVNEDQCMELLLKEVPKFEPAWLTHLEYWGEDKAGLSNDISEFSAYIISSITEMDDSKKQSLFLLVEELLNTGGDAVKDAIATCFLENILNAISDKKISSDEFVHLLGNKSRAYCKSWDEYTEVETPNL